MAEINLTPKEEKDLLFKALFGSPFFNILASVLATFIVGAVFFKYGGGVPITVTSTSTEKVSAFQVSGEGKVTVVPDEARVRLGVRKEGPRVADLQEAANQTLDALISELKELGVKREDVKTVSYSVSPNYSYSPESGSRTAGYVIYAEVEVKIREMEKASQALDLVGKLGLEQVGGVTFGLSDELEEKTVREARELAIGEAKDKAEELAKLAGMKLGKIVNVQEGSNMPQPYVMRESLAMDAKGGGEEPATPTPVEPGSSEVAVSVTLSYETL